MRPFLLGNNWNKIHSWFNLLKESVSLFPINLKFNCQWAQNMKNLDEKLRFFENSTYVWNVV